MKLITTMSLLAILLGCVPEITYKKSCDCTEGTAELNNARAEWILKAFRKGEHTTGNFEESSRLANQLNLVSIDLFCPTQKALWDQKTREYLFCNCLSQDHKFYKYCFRQTEWPGN